MSCPKISLKVEKLKSFFNMCSKQVRMAVLLFRCDPSSITYKSTLMRIELRLWNQNFNPLKCNAIQLRSDGSTWRKPIGNFFLILGGLYRARVYTKGNMRVIWLHAFCLFSFLRVCWKKYHARFRELIGEIGKNRFITKLHAAFLKNVNSELCQVYGSGF